MGSFSLFSSKMLLNNLIRKYPTNTYPTLKSINLELCGKGLISIVGKSGCGKSTLLNILALYDKPNSGQYIFNGVDTSKLSNKQREDFMNNKIGMVFQHYYLLEDYDVLFNISLPRLIRGGSLKETKNDAIKLLKSISFPESFYHKKVKDLSGGEKQRIAILRSIINSPNVLLCDEPTGALDSENSIKIMELLKTLSKDRLVIIVSHNKQLVNRYSDRIIELKDGMISSDKIINKIEDKINNKDVRYKRKNKWVELIAKHNLKKRFKRNLFSILSLSISLIATTLVIGFAINNGKVVDNECKKKIDYGVATVAKEEKSGNKESLISIVQQSRPDIYDIDFLVEKYPSLLFTYNYEILFPMDSKIKYNDKEIKDIAIRPIYNFDNKMINHDLLLEGSFPSIDDSLYQVIINKKCLDYLKNLLKINPINQKLNISTSYESTYYTFDANGNIIKDIFVLDGDFEILGVVDELDFLSTPTIYYSYDKFIDYLSTYKLQNYSEYIKEDISWKYRIDNANESEELSSYSLRAFLKDYKDNYLLKDIAATFNEEFSFTSLALTVEESLTSLMFASTAGMEIFLIIAVIGVVMIIGIISFFSYTEDKQKCAIMSALGSSRSSISSIYLYENIIVGFISTILGLALSFPMILLGNILLKKYIGIDKLLIFPTNIFTKYKFEYFILIFVIVFLVILIATNLPISLSKKISISQELRDE